MTADRARQDFVDKTNVSRETIADLEVYEKLLRKWSKSINLVAKSTLDEVWTRHFLDSAQIFEHRKTDQGTWADLGAGGGFPGVVVAIMAKYQAAGLDFVFVESDRRKAVFLQSVIRELGLAARVISERIEETPPLDADIISARALAPLTTLLGYTDRHIKSGGQALFLKGASFHKEVQDALETWRFQSDEYPSVTDEFAVILSLGDIKRV